MLRNKGLRGVDKMSTVIHHGTTSQGATPPLTITAVLFGEFGSMNALTGLRQYSQNGNVNVIKENDNNSNMPNTPPILAGSTYTWGQAVGIEVTSIANQAGTAWNGSPLDPNFTFTFTALEQQFADVCNQWAVTPFNTKGFADLTVTFASGGHPCNTQPAVGSLSPTYTCRVVVTEVSSGKSATITFTPIRFENQTFAI